MPKRIFIGSVSVTTTDDTLHRAFSRYGTIVTAVVDRSAVGESLGTAHIVYTTDQAGTDAIVALNRTMLDGSMISVS
jgi:RNA recognition motif-containing protein